MSHPTPTEGWDFSQLWGLDADEEEHLILTESDDNTVVTVPLVVYISGKRHVIGEATVRGKDITMAVGTDVSEEIMDQLHLRPDYSQFAIDFTEGPNPFRANSNKKDK